jgi:hypothetical protein
VSEIYIVKPGDYMEKIAKDQGFHDFHVIYDDLNNKAFKALRPNPHILYPGDKVFIPDKQEGHEVAQTDKKHTFTLNAHKLQLILRLRHHGKPFANRKYSLQIGTQTITGTTGADGLIEKDIPTGVALATLIFRGSPPYTRKLNLGFLHPITTVSGRKMRLNNLGFACGAPDGVENAAYTAAVLAFQKKYLPNDATGKADDATIDKLRSEYEQGIPS